MKNEQDVIKVNGSLATTLIGQLGYSDDAQAFMLRHGELMVICTSSDGPNYMTKKQAIEMFEIKKEDLDD